MVGIFTVLPIPSKETEIWRTSDLPENLLHQSFLRTFSPVSSQTSSVGQIVDKLYKFTALEKQVVFKGYFLISALPCCLGDINITSLCV